jgi:hypothetical protein
MHAQDPVSYAHTRGATVHECIRAMPTSQLLRLVHVLHHLHITALHMVRLLNLMQDLLFRRAIARPLHRLFQEKIVLLLLQYASA